MAGRRVVVSVIGSRLHAAETSDLAYSVGRLIARAGAVLVCGGLKGVMESAAKGAREAGGLTIGLIPSLDVKDANPYIDIALPMSIGFARNALVASAGDIIIALPGKHGTLTEICYGLFFGRPVIDLGQWGMEGMLNVRGLDDTERELKRLVGEVESGVLRPSPVNSVPV